MPSVTRTFTVDVPPTTALAYLADFANAEEWDPGTERCVRADSGPVQPGASWDNTSKIAGISTELTFTLEELRDDRVVLIGRNETATSTETIDVTPNGAGSTVSYTNDLEFSGAAKLASPVAKVVFEKLGHDTEEQLTRALNALGER